jgi:hypothetical protein
MLARGAITLQKGVFVENLKEEIVLSPDQLMSVLAAGESHRHVGATNYNSLSSRSHTIFRVLIESRERQDEILSLTPGGFTGGAVRSSYLVCDETHTLSLSPLYVSLCLIDIDFDL